MLRFRFTPQEYGYKYAISIERASDRKRFDFGDGAFKDSGHARTLEPATEGEGEFRGRYSVVYGPTPAVTQFWDGTFVVTVHREDGEGGFTTQFECGVDFTKGSSAFYGGPPFVTF